MNPVNNTNRKNGGEPLPDLPTGFGMRLAMNEPAMTNFAKLDNYQKRRIIDYIESAVTGPDALDRVESAVRELGGYNKDISETELKKQL